MQSEVMLGGVIDEGLLSGSTGPVPRVKGEVIRFYNRTVPDANKSTSEGRPVHASRPYIEIRVPGDRTNVVDRPVTEADKQRFAHHWLQFQAGNTEQVVGTPLEMWPRISAPQVEDLKHFRVRTVEQLSEISDNHLQALGPDGRALRDEAKAWLEAAKGTAPIARLQAALGARDNEIAALKQQVESLQKAMASRKDK